MGAGGGPAKGSGLAMAPCLAELLAIMGIFYPCAVWTSFEHFGFFFLINLNFVMLIVFKRHKERQAENFHLLLCSPNV